MAESRQEIVVLRQDKDYLTRQYNDIQQKFYSAEEKISTLENSLDETKRAKELLYEKHISTRFEQIFRIEFFIDLCLVLGMHIKLNMKIN